MHLLFCLHIPQVHKMPRDASRPSQPSSHLTVYRISHLTRSRRPQFSSPTHPHRHSSQSKSGAPSRPQPLHRCLGWPRGERSWLLWEGPGAIELPRLWARSGPGWREKRRTALLLPPRWSDGPKSSVPAAPFFPGLPVEGRTLTAGPRTQARAPASMQSQRAGGGLEGRMVRPEPAAGGRSGCGVWGRSSTVEWRGPAAPALRGAAPGPGRAAGARLTGGRVTQWRGGGGASAQVGGGAWAPPGVNAESR